MLGIQRLGLALVVGRLEHLVVPDVASVLHLAVGLGRLDDEHFSTVGISPITSSTSSLTGAGLPLRRAPSAVIRSLASETSMRSVTDRREAAEDHVVRGADARAGQHRHDDLGDHGQEDPDDVALFDPVFLQGVGQLWTSASSSA